MVSGTSSPPWFSSPTHAASPASVLSMMNVALREGSGEANGGGGTNDPHHDHKHHHQHHQRTKSTDTRASGGSCGSSMSKKSTKKAAASSSLPSVARLRAQAPRLLRQIDDSDLFQKAHGPTRPGSREEAGAATTTPPAPVEWARSIARFDKDEVVLGPILGMGGFCSVYQVESFRLKKEEEENDGRNQHRSPTASLVPAEAALHQPVVVSLSGNHHDHSHDHSDDDDDQGGGDRPRHLPHLEDLHRDDDDSQYGDRFWSASARRRRGGGGGGSCASSVASTLSSCGSWSPASSLHGGGSAPNSPIFGSTRKHPALSSRHRAAPLLQLPYSRGRRMDPRLFMQQRARRRGREMVRPPSRGGASAAAAPHHRNRNQQTKEADENEDHTEARYAIKRLHWDTLNEFERVRGSIDLAMEAKYLSALRHPNIVKMRGMASGDVLDKNFFIIMDRLYGTLADKIKSWRQAQRDCRGGWFGLFPDHDRMEHILIERLIVAYDVSSALSYMHKNRLVYRDIKKENIGFDVRGDSKIFDFGLSKCLSQDLKARDPVTGQEVYGYKLTPRTGSVCTMAPEVASGRPYDEKCDVFSFAILLWEILALESPFPSYSRKDYMFRVVELEERPWIHMKWPAVTKKLLRQAWDGDPEMRPGMRKVSAMLRADLNALTDAPEVKHRTIHMLNRSTHSFCMEPRDVSLDREADNARAWHEDDMSCEESYV